MKCKLLWAKGNVGKAEEKVNQWLAENPNIDIKHVGLQRNWAFAIFYEEK